MSTKISVLQENLAEGLALAKRAVSTRSTLPVLSHYLLATDNGRLKVAATNLEMLLVTWVGAKIDGEGSITVPASTLFDLVRYLPKEKVELSWNDTPTLNIQVGRSKANVKGYEGEEFPLISPIPETPHITMPAETLKETIGLVALAAATDETRPTLTGVMVAIDGKDMTTAATDGFRLSVRDTQLTAPVSSTRVIIPARTLVELSRILDEKEGVNIYFPDNRSQVVFCQDNFMLVSQLIDGAYPDYSPIIPRHHNTRVVVGTAALAGALKTADVFARESSRTVKLAVGEDSLTISAQSAETGDNTGKVEAVVEGKELEIALNVSYLQEVLAAVSGAPQVALELNAEMDPAVLKVPGDDDFIHIIMPMHFGR